MSSETKALLSFEFAELQRSGLAVRVLWKLYVCRLGAFKATGDFPVCNGLVELFPFLFRGAGVVIYNFVAQYIAKVCRGSQRFDEINGVKALAHQAALHINDTGQNRRDFAVCDLRFQLFETQLKDMCCLHIPQMDPNLGRFANG